jgi:serine/threonine-protein kinase
MASVFLAVFSGAHGAARPAVLKQLHPGLARDPDFRAMFQDEARLATRLHHDNVVETYDVYCDSDFCVLLMEFLEGQSLSRVRQTAHRMGSLPLSIQLHCLSQVLAGLHYVHELHDERGNPLRIVHRDVTPSNVFVTYDGGVKVVDFGIAKASTQLAETRVGVIKGKLFYMSPEAVRGDPVDRRSDIFSVGIMLWEALTGRRLWQDHDESAVLQRLAAGIIPSCPQDVTISDPAAFAIAERALAGDPNRRYATAAEMRRDIEGLLERQGIAMCAPTLGGYMQSCFAEERQKIRALIDEAARATSSSQQHFFLTDLTEDTIQLEATEPPTTISIPPAPVFRTMTIAGLPPAPKRVAMPWKGWALAAGAITLAAGVAFFAHAPRSLHAEPSVVPELAPLAPAASSTDPNIDADDPGKSLTRDVEVAPASVTVVFSAHPPEARLFLDGERLEGNPVILRRQPDQKAHRVRIEAPGFTTFSRSFRLDEDTSRTFTFDLVRKPRAARPAASAEPTPTECPRARQMREAAEAAAAATR